MPKSSSSPGDCLRKGPKYVQPCTRKSIVSMVARDTTQTLEDYTEQGPQKGKCAPREVGAPDESALSTKRRARAIHMALLSHTIAGEHHEQNLETSAPRRGYLGVVSMLRLHSGIRGRTRQV